MSKYSWIVDRVQLNHWDLKQIGEEVIYNSKLGDYSFKLNIDINKLAKIAKEIKEKKEYNNGIKCKRNVNRKGTKYKTKKFDIED